MKITGISRIRNESHIIKDTLDHVSTLVDDVVIYDDCSEDDTVAICEAHPKVKKVLRGHEWSPSRDAQEGPLRQMAYDEAMKGKPDWIYCFDADEFASFDGIDFTAGTYRLKLFDFYITEEDKDKPYTEREWIGPEYRDIDMLFRATKGLTFKQRIPLQGCKPKVNAGYVKHYGKGFSIEEFEKTCEYYEKFFPRYAQRWARRKGKAIHTQSDFGRPLIKWKDRNESELVRIR